LVFFSNLAFLLSVLTDRLGVSANLAAVASCHCSPRNSPW
jgi:hypothetical protein